MPTTQILYFASLRDRLGRSEETVVLPAEVRTVRALLAWLRAREPAFALLLEEGQTIRVAVNQGFAAIADPVAPGDEIALFPPVTGG